MPTPAKPKNARRQPRKGGESPAVVRRKAAPPRKAAEGPAVVRRKAAPPRKAAERPAVVRRKKEVPPRKAAASPAVVRRKEAPPRKAAAGARVAGDGKDGKEQALVPEPPPERRERRALSHVGGRVVVRGGDDALAAVLEEALDVPRADESGRDHMHGFHSYAARLHPRTARVLVERLTDPSETVLDPFMGSGTVLVEARLLGRAARGTDLNPLSPDLVHLKTRGSTAEERQALLDAGARAAEQAEERRIARRGPTHKYAREDLELFDVHMLLELDGLMQGIGLEQPGFAREALKLVVSSILVKVSKQPGDTVERTSPRRLAGGFAIRLFQKKTEELASRLEQYQALLPAGAPPCDLAIDDARELSSVADGSIDLVLASPPYPGIYDYARHHAARLRWLGLDGGGFEKNEMGARRNLRMMARDDAIDAWADDFVGSLRAIRRVLSPTGAATLVLSDSVVQGRPLYADDAMQRLAPHSGLLLVATASQPRPHFHEPTKHAFRNRPRMEHVFVLVPGG